MILIMEVVIMERRVSIRRAVEILAKNGISVDYNEASVILDFLYLLAKNFHGQDGNQNILNVKEASNFNKTSKK